MSWHYGHRFVCSIVIACVAFLLGPALAQAGRCKAPKQWFDGKCRYADEIEKLKKPSSTRPASATPSPVPHTPTAPSKPRTGRDEPKPTLPPAPEEEPPTTMEPEIEPGPPPETATKAEAPVALNPQEPPQTDHTTVGLGWQRIAALMLGGAGVVSAAVGTGFAVSAASTYSDSEPLCSDNLCSQPGLDTRKDAFSLATGANVAFVVAGVTMAGGLVLWLTAPSNKEEPQIGLAVEPGLGGARLHVRW